MSTTSSWIDIWIKELECEARFAFPLIIKMQIKEVPYSIQVFVPPPPPLCVSIFIYMALILLILTTFQPNLIVWKT